MLWTPSDCPGVVAWFDAATIGSFTLGSSRALVSPPYGTGPEVTEWRNMLGGGAFPLSPPGTPPVLISNAMNGHPAVVFELDNELRNASFPHPADDFTVLAIASFYAVQANDEFLMRLGNTATPSENWSVLRVDTNTNEMAIYADATHFSSTVISDEADFIFAFRSGPDNDPSNYTYRIDGAATGAFGNVVLTTLADGLLLANGGFFAGKIAVMVAVSGATSLADIQKLEGWAAHTYGLTLDPAHPYAGYAPLQGETPLKWGSDGRPAGMVVDVDKIDKGFLRPTSLSELTAGIVPVDVPTAGSFSQVLPNLGNAASPGVNNVAYGPSALWSTTGGTDNVATGTLAMYTNTWGYSDCAYGHRAMYSNTYGFENAAFGYGALSNNTTGANNTAVGAGSMGSCDMGGANTAVGCASLAGSTGSTGHNTGVGYRALASNASGNYNTAVGSYAGDAGPACDLCTYLGYQAKASVDSPSNSMALGNGAQVSASNQVVIGNSSVTDTFLRGKVQVFGYFAQNLPALTSGTKNTAYGFNALNATTSAFGCTAVGYNALMNAVGAANINTAFGYQAMDQTTSGGANTAIGADAGKGGTGVFLQTHSYCTYLGRLTGATADGFTESVAIGNGAKISASHQIMLGAPGVTSLVLASGKYSQPLATPASSGAAGNQGQICWDADYIYVCTAPSTWKRAALTTW
jgi:hypothetical protein